MRIEHLLALAAALATAVPGCGASSRSSESSASAQSRTLSETRALVIIAETLSDHAIPRGSMWQITLPGGEALDVDVRLAQSQFGIEWMSPQDRSDLGEAVPGPTEDGRLRIVPGRGEEQVLVLEHSSYDFVNEREHVQAGRAGARETEERLRRDVVDFIHYVQGQGGL